MGFIRLDTDIICETRLTSAALSFGNSLSTAIRESDLSGGTLLPLLLPNEHPKMLGGEYLQARSPMRGASAFRAADKSRRWSGRRDLNSHHRYPKPVLYQIELLPESDEDFTNRSPEVCAS